MTRACSTLATLTTISKVSWSEIQASTNFQPIHMEREQCLCAGEYEPVFWRLGNANGYKSKRVDTPAGTLSLSVPKTTDHLEKGVRRTILCAISGTGVGLQSYRYPSCG